MQTEFRSGDWVQVREWGEIAQTLDGDGTLDGLPFMPEMMEYCGRRYQVERYAEKICVEAPGGQFVDRAFNKKDIVLLDNLRCTGLSHDGCQRLCMIFWKVAWVRKCAEGEIVASGDQRKPLTDLINLKVKASPTQYFCQATQLLAISHYLCREDTISQIKTDLRTRAISLFAMIPLIIVPYLRKLRNRYFGRPRFRGTLTRTPVQHLGLEPGEWVEIKPQHELLATLDKEGRNRGLSCDIEFAQFCGKQYRVRSRLERMISEATGQMRKVDSTVTLDGISCLCSFSVGGCPRSDFSYFREVWLRRVDDPPRLPKDSIVGKQRGCDRGGHDHLADF